MKRGEKIVEADGQREGREREESKVQMHFDKRHEGEGAKGALRGEGDFFTLGSPLNGWQAYWVIGTGIKAGLSASNRR